MKIKYPTKAVSKPMKHLIFLSLLFICFSSDTYAQVGINPNGNSPDPSAMLDVNSTESGILIPRMSSSQKNNISNPADGLFIFDNDTKSFWFYDSSTTSWKEINTDEQTISLTDDDLSISNGNMVDLSNYLDNTDAQTISLSNNNLSISNGNTVNLSSFNTDLYSTNGTLSEDRNILFADTETELKLVSEDNRGLLSLVRTDNDTDLGIGFRNETASPNYTGGIVSSALGNGNDNGLDFFTIGTTTNIDNIGISLRLKNDGSIVLPDYGQGNNTGTLAELLAVDANGDLIEVNSSAINSDIYSTDGSVSGTRTISFSNSKLQLTSDNNRGVLALKKLDNSNDLGISL